MIENSKSDPISRFLEQVGAPAAILDSLLRDDNWSFVIKIHAILEAVVAQLLVDAFGDKRTRDVISFLDLSDKRRGKMAFVAALDLLEPRVRKFVHAMSTLRNYLVHDISNANFTFDVYIRSLDKNQRKAFADGISSPFADEIVDGDHKSPRSEFALKHPWVTIFCGTCIVILSSSIKQMEYSERERKLKFAEDLLPLLLAEENELNANAE
jgi:hypothetical protein